ncbi:MAG: hypothetical protein Q8K60_01905, partial [Parachlamydiaceae bacterium]|nr:hypothetical protein [Parachlamydiaceae bacterium]
TLVINEGISTYFSIIVTSPYCENGDDLIEDMRQHSKNYFYAYECVKELLEIDPSAIKTLRQSTPLIDKLTEKDFDALNVNIPKELKSNLLLPFFKLSIPDQS